MRTCLQYAVGAALSIVMSIGTARAQLFEEVGTRAQGMGGAFVAVADDATATWWNPAGLAGAGLFSLVTEKNRVTQPENPVLSVPGRRTSDTSFAVVFPSLGVSYYRLRVSQIAPITTNDGLSPNRQDQGVLAARADSLTLAQLGLTVGQSFGHHAILGTTLKLIRGGVGEGVVDGSSDLLDAVDDLELARSTKADLDVGAMLSFSAFRAGVTVRNLTRPTFRRGDADAGVTLPRLVRAGLAVMTPPTNTAGGLTLAFDADLTKTATVFGNVRHLAAGGEAWLLKRRLGLRGGITANTIGERRPSISTGVSVATTRSMFIEGGRIFGTDESIRGWTSAVRFAF